MDQITADLQAKKNQLQYTNLYSPISGYVQHIDTHDGEFVNTGTSVVTLIDVERMEVEVGLPYNIYQQRNFLTDFIAIFNGKEYSLTRLNIIPKAGSTQQYTMLLALPFDEVLKEASGINVEVRFTASGNNNCLPEMTIPESAIIYDGSQPNVWILRGDSTVTRQPIEIGTVIDGRVNVLRGLEGSETIVKAGVSILHNGEK